MTQLLPLAQLPQLPPQPSEPHSLPEHDAVQHEPPTQLPVPQPQSMQLAQVSPPAASHTESPQPAESMQLPAEQILPDGQLPQLPAQPSSPQVLPEQAGVQQLPPTQVPLVQPQSKGQLSHDSPESQLPLPHWAWVMHLLSAHS